MQTVKDSGRIQQFSSKQFKKFDNSKTTDHPTAAICSYHLIVHLCIIPGVFSVCNK